MSEIASETQGEAERMSRESGSTLHSSIPRQLPAAAGRPWPQLGQLPLSSGWRPRLDINGRMARLLDHLNVSARAAMAMSGLGLLLVLIVGAAAPNANTVHVRGPLAVLPAMPTPVAYAMVELAICLETLGLAFMLWAHHRGWQPNARKLYLAAAGFVVLMVNLSPVGSSDSASYAAYGRMFDLGHDVYGQGPLSLGGAYARIVDIQWINTSSVYGPVATWIQAIGAFFGQDHPARTIWFLMVVNGAVFLAVGWLLLRFAKSPARATLLWTANPMVLHQLVAGGHLDTFVAAAGICAVLFARRFGTAGAFVALGAGFKISAGLIGAGFVVDRAEKRDWRGLTRFLTVAGIVLLVLYGLVGLHALQPLSSASAMVSTTSPWHLVTWLGGYVLGDAGAHKIVQVGWVLAMLILAARLRNKTPENASPLVRVQFALSFAWIVAAPWVLPWYTAPAWAFAALLPRTRLVGWLIAYSFLLAVLHASGGTPAGYRTSAPERIGRGIDLTDTSGSGTPPPPSSVVNGPPWGAASPDPKVGGQRVASFALAV